MHGLDAGSGEEASRRMRFIRFNLRGMCQQWCPLLCQGQMNIPRREEKWETWLNEDNVSGIEAAPSLSIMHVSNSIQLSSDPSASSNVSSTSHYNESLDAAESRELKTTHSERGESPQLTQDLR